MTYFLKPVQPPSGTVTIPGDKSISHRALMFGAIADGTTTITGLLEGEDVLRTAHAVQTMGAGIERGADGTWHVTGTATGTFQTPATGLDMGNSGTSTRLLMGLLMGHGISVRMTGDASLTKRPMKRVMTPLEMMGARFDASEGGRLPLTFHAPENVAPIEYTLPVASAQVKSAILLAGLRANGATTVIENEPTRDHTENMLRAFGVSVDTQGNRITVTGPARLKAASIAVPGDPSSAAFIAALAVLCGGSDITMPGICMNPTRRGFFVVLKAMGASIDELNTRLQGGETVCDLRVRGTGPLTGVDVDPALVPSMIDEIPILSMVAANARGTTRLTGVAELRVKESDRLALVASGLAACGVKVEEGPDWLAIHGMGLPPAGGALIEAALDHRIAMSFLILGTTTAAPVRVDDVSPIATSFPNFFDVMAQLGIARAK